MKRNEVLRVGIILALALLVVASCKKDEDTGTVLNFDIAIPVDWQKFVYNDENFRLYAVSPDRLADDQAGVRDTLQETLWITRESLPGSGLAEYFDLVTENLLIDAQDYFAVITVDTTINGEPSVRHVHTQTIRQPIPNSPNDSVDLTIQLIKYFFYHNEYGYIVDLTTVPYAFDYYDELLKDMMSTFVFLN